MNLLLKLDNNKIIIEYYILEYDYTEPLQDDEVYLEDVNDLIILKIQSGLTKYIDSEFDYTNNNENIYKQALKDYRQTHVFDIINRGNVWFNTLTIAQKAQLNTWYQSWLNVDTTLVVPETPTFLEDIESESSTNFNVQNLDFLKQPIAFPEYDSNKESYTLSIDSNGNLIWKAPYDGTASGS